MSRIGLLGGSFDPVHDAHIALAEAALHTLELAEVQLIPAANPWQREPLKAAPEHRLRMLELAVAGHAGLSVNAIEITRGGATYTIDTLRALPPARYVWLLGADQLVNFTTWHAWQDIAARVDLAVAVRPGTVLQVPDDVAKLLARHGHVLQELPFAPMDVSASHIRAQLAGGAPPANLLDPAVAGYIARHGLYH